MQAKFSSLPSVVPARRGGSFTRPACRDSRLPVVTPPRHLSPSPSINSELFHHPFESKSNPCHSYELLGGGGGHPRVHISLIPQHLTFLHRPQCARSCSSLVTRHSSLSPKPLPAITYNDCSAKPLRAITYENSGGRGGAHKSRILLNPQHLVFSALALLSLLTVRLLAHRTNGHTAPFVSEWLARPCASLNCNFAELLRRLRSCAA
jgi:hypothetical protein